jgi:hypothetical protein
MKGEARARHHRPNFSDGHNEPSVTCLGALLGPLGRSLQEDHACRPGHIRKTGRTPEGP